MRDRPYVYKGDLGIWLVTNDNYIFDLLWVYEDSIKGYILEGSIDTILIPTDNENDVIKYLNIFKHILIRKHGEDIRT